jgi:flagellar motility protein MotE (MotC chaperone)
MKKHLLSPRFLLPFAILLGLLVMTTHIADVWDTLASGKLLVRTAQAKSSEEHPPAAEAKEKAAEEEHDNKAEDKNELSAPPEAEASPAELDILKQLSERREQLEKRSRDMDTREALLRVTEQRVTQKIKEMEVLRSQVQSLVDQAAGAQQAQLDNLVKIYETMKPEEAAKIFEALDMPILLGVIQRMKPARTAPIMAKMPPEKAKEVTIALTKQDQLPQVR